ncbi:MAG: hypothetical protein ACQEP1_01635 [Nanobdellota archaeon]
MKRYLLLLFFLLSLTFNLVHTGMTDEFTGDQAYLTLRNVENIMEEGVPLNEDELSYGGRSSVHAPLFYYLLAAFSFLMPVAFAAKVVPALISASLIFIIYAVSLKLTSDRRISIIASFMAIFIPVFTRTTLNSASPITLFIPLFFLALYFFIDLNRRNITYFVIAFLAMLLTHPLSILFIVSLLVYMVLIRTEEMNLDNKETELILFSTFFLAWAYFLLYKPALIQTGPNIIWENIPMSLRSFFFPDFNIVKGIAGIGIVPFLSGVYVIYSFFFRKKRKRNYLYMSIMLAVLVALWFRMISLGFGLSILAILFIILFSYYYKGLETYIKKTKIRNRNIVFGVIILVFVLTSVPGTFRAAMDNVDAAFDHSEVEDMLWLRENTDKDSVILADAFRGNFISYYSKRKNVADTNFLQAPDPGERVNDIKTIYTTSYQTEAIPLLTKYGVDYIYVNDDLRNVMGIDEIDYLEDKCFERMSNEAFYKVKCEMEEKHGG